MKSALLLTAVMFLALNTANSYAGTYKIFTRAGASAGCKDSSGNNADCSKCNLGYDKSYYGQDMKYNSQLASQTGNHYHCSNDGAVNGRIVTNSVENHLPNNQEGQIKLNPLQGRNSLETVE